MHARRPNAFTLVELLVVIGIIALLISILLPGLSKARQQANLLDCQSRLRTMGQSLAIYVTSNKGSLPWGVVDHNAAWTNTAPFTPSTADQERFNWWMFTLSEYMQKDVRGPDGYARISPVFRDKETIDAPAEPRYVNHYTANPRVFYQANAYDSAPAIFSSYALPPEDAQDRRQRKMGNVKKTSNVFAIWDGPQFVDQQFNAYPLASAIDSFGMDNTTGLCFDAPFSGNKYGRAILPGVNSGITGVSDGKAAQKTRNADFEAAFDWLSGFRFRHLGNTALAALCLDGHVEVRKVGTVMRGDIFTNYR